MQAAWNVPGTVQVGPSATSEEARARQIVAGKQQAHLQPVDSLQGSGEAGAGTSATSPDELYTNFSQYQFAYRRQGHCTETALLDVLDNVYTAI